MPASRPDTRKVCLFGGTFDPIHSAHLQIAQAAAAQFALERILFIPAGSPPHKTNHSIAPYEDRFRMVQLACEPYGNFEASRLEAGHERSYTIDTVKRFRQTLEPGIRICFLIGADAFFEIESWKDWRELVQMIEFIVVTRPGGSYVVPEGACVTPLNGIELPVSSSSIRARLAAREPTPELPGEVRAYIDAHNLYRVGTQTTV